MLKPKQDKKADFFTTPYTNKLLKSIEERPQDHVYSSQSKIKRTRMHSIEKVSHKTTYTRCNYLFLCVFALLLNSITFTMKKILDPYSSALTITHIEAANTFTAEFPAMTFKKAKETFGSLTKEAQTQVWANLATFEKSTDNLLPLIPLALHLTFLPKELQYVLLSEDDSNHTNIQAIMDSRSIYEHFRWRAMIDVKCGDKNYLCTQLQYKEPYINLTKQELFELNCDKTKVIQKLTCFMKKNELLLFTQLPKPLLEKIYLNYSKIQFYYRDKQPLRQQCITMLKDAFDSCKRMLPPIALLLLYSHFVTIPAWNCVNFTRDPVALQKNLKIKEINSIIENLNKSHCTPIPIPKHDIHPIPYEFPIASLCYTYAPIIIPSSAMYLNKIRNKILYKNRLETVAELSMANCLGGIGLLMCVFGSRIVLRNGLPMGLAELTTIASLCGIIKGKINASQWKCGTINLNNSTVDTYLNDSTIEIKDF